MIAPIAVVLALSCPAPVIENISGLAWNAEDQKTLDAAKKRCVQIWADAPCVKWFQKREKLMYRVICGAPTKDGS